MMRPALAARHSAALPPPAFSAKKGKMKHQFTAIIERGEKYLIATCAEVPEAHGQGSTREEVRRDLAGSIQSVLEYRREEALSIPDPPSV